MDVRRGPEVYPLWEKGVGENRGRLAAMQTVQRTLVAGSFPCPAGRAPPSSLQLASAQPRPLPEDEGLRVKLWVELLEALDAHGGRRGDRQERVTGPDPVGRGGAALAAASLHRPGARKRRSCLYAKELSPS